MDGMRARNSTPDVVEWLLHRQITMYPASLPLPDPTRPPPAWYPAAALWDNPQLLTQLVSRTAAEKGASSTVIGSYLLQACVNRLATAAIHARLDLDATLDLRPERVLMHVHGERVTKIAIVAGESVAVDWSGYAPLLEHIRSAVAAFTAAIRIGQRTLWGNAEAAIVGPFVKLHDAAGRSGRDAGYLVAAVRELIEEADFTQYGLGQLLLIGKPDGPRLLRLSRNTCCLKYKMDQQYCGECTIIPKSTKIERWASEVSTRGGSRAMHGHPASKPVQVSKVT